MVEGNTDGQQWISYFKEHENISELNRKLAVELIDRITVYEQQKIHIQFKYQRQYENALAFIKSVESIHAAPSELEVM
mgnify:CR=1 FL=1